MRINSFSRFTFAVDSVTPTLSPLAFEKIDEHIVMLLQDAEERVSTPVVFCSDADSRVVKDLSYHSLVAAVHAAFSQHRPLILSPPARS